MDRIVGHFVFALSCTVVCALDPATIKNSVVRKLSFRKDEIEAFGIRSWKPGNYIKILNRGTIRSMMADLSPPETLDLNCHFFALHLRPFHPEQLSPKIKEELAVCAVNCYKAELFVSLLPGIGGIEDLTSLSDIDLHTSKLSTEAGFLINAGDYQKFASKYLPVGMFGCFNGVNKANLRAAVFAYPKCDVLEAIYNSLLGGADETMFSAKIAIGILRYMTIKRYQSHLFDFSDLLGEDEELIEKFHTYNTSMGDGDKDADEGVSLEASKAIALLHRLAPEGLFHQFNEKQCYLVNLLRPDRELTDRERDFWFECLVGAQRSMMISYKLSQIPVNEALPKREIEIKPRIKNEEGVFYRPLCQTISSTASTLKEAIHVRL